MGVEDGVHLSGSLFSCLPRWAREPGQEQGGGGSASLEGHERFFDFLEIGFVLYQVVTSDHTGGHDENDLRKVNSTLIPKNLRHKNLTS